MSQSALAAGVRRLRSVAATLHRPHESDAQLLQAFAQKHDESAFAALVRRHGPMVAGVCRRVLGHEQDAEDAFQATFLVLARRAATLRDKTTLAGFLHGTAHRLALMARRTANRRRKHENRAPSRPSVNPSGELLWCEVQALLDDEIARLPERYRIVFVLCCLESLSRTETARRLGLKEGTVASRLAEARKRLQRRLSRRGVELTALLAATALTTETARALPATLLRATTGAAVASVVVPRGLSLVGLGKIKVATLLLLATSALAGAGLWLGSGQGVPVVASPLAAEPEKADKPKPPAPPQEPKSSVPIGGRVLDPKGKPVSGAKVLFLWWGEKLPSKVWATSDTAGRFTFTVAREDVTANAPWKIAGRIPPYVVAAAEGHGLAVARLANPEAAGKLTLRLVKDDVPIRGRVLDLQGRPIAGVKVRINDREPYNQAQLYVPSKGDLTDWLAALKTSEKDPWRVEEDHLMSLASPDFHLLVPPITTGADGRFVLRGIGRERLVHLRLEGPTIATQIVSVMTRPSEPIRLPLSRNHPKGEAITYYGADLQVLAMPTKPVMGVVRDRDTGKPLAGVTILPNKIANPFGISNYQQGLIRTTTDKEGRYRLVGLPKGEDNRLLATTDDLPYLPMSKRVENTPGLGPVTVDFALKRGVLVKGRVTEKTTGKPLQGFVGYYCFADNPNAKEIPLAFAASLGGATRKDGSFQFVVVPGRGILAVQVAHNDRYLRGVGADQIKTRRADMGGIDCFMTYPFPCQIPNMNTLAEINPKPEDESVTCNLIVASAAP